MRLDARVTDVCTSILVLVAADRRIWNRAIRLRELRSRYPRHFGPRRFSGLEIKPLMEVNPRAQSRLVDHEEVAQPVAEEAHHRRVTIRESDLTVRLRAFAGVERGASREKRLLVEGCEPDFAFCVQGSDLSLLGL